MATNTNKNVNDILGLNTPEVEKGIETLSDLSKVLKETHGALDKFKNDKPLHEVLLGKGGKEADKHIKETAKSVTDLLKKVSGAKSAANSGVFKDALNPVQLLEIKKEVNELEGELSNLGVGLAKIQDNFEGAPQDIQKVFENLAKALPTEALIEFGKSSGRTSKEISEDYDKIIKQNKALGVENKKLAKAFGEATDPEILELYKNKWEENKAAIEANNASLQKNIQLQKLGVRGLTEGAGDTGQETLNRINGWLGKISDKASSVSDVLERNHVSLGKFTADLDLFGYKLEGNKTSVADFIKGFSEATEGFKNNVEKIDEWRNNILNMSSALKNNSVRLLEYANNLSGTSKVASVIAPLMAGVAGGLSAVAAAAASLAVVLAPIAIAVGLVIAALKVMDAVTGRSEEAIKDRIDAIHEEMDALEDVNRLIREGSVEAYEREIQSIREQIAAKEREAQALRDAAVANTSVIDQWRTAIGSFFGDTTVYGQTGDSLREINEQINDLNTQLTQLNDPALREVIERVKELNDVAQRAEEALRRVEQSEESLVQMRVEAFDREQKFREELNELDEKFAEEGAQIAENREREDRKRYKDYLNDLQKMQEDYNNTIEDLQQQHLKEMAKKEKDYQNEVKKDEEDYQKSLAEAATSYQEEVADAAKSYYEESVQSEIDYNEKIADMEERYNKDKIKRQKDLQYSLFEAELNNDALQFFQLQRQGEKEEKEAEEQHKEEMAEEAEAREKEKQERLQDYIEQANERKTQYDERIAEMRTEHEEQKAERAKQFQEELANMRAEQEERLKEEKYNYEQERAQKARQFEEGQEQLEAQRAEEDAKRQEQREERRQELEDNFAQEMEYFQRREALLIEYINNLQAIEAERTAAYGALADRVLTPEEANELADNISAEIDRLENIQEAGGTLSADEQAHLDDLRRIQNDLTTSLANGVPLSISPEDSGLLRDVIDIGVNERLAQVDESYDNALEYTDEMRVAAADAAEQLGATGTAFEQLQTDHQSFLDSLGLQQTEHGLASQQEISDQNNRYRRILEEEGDENVDALATQVSNTNDAITTGFDQMQQTREEAQDEEALSLQDHFYTQQGYTSSYHQENEQLSADHYSNSLASQEEAQNSFLGAQEESNNNLLEGQAAADEQELLSQEEQNAALSEQTATQNEEELVAEQEQHDSLLSEQDRYANELQRKIVDMYKRTTEAVARESQTGLRTVVNVYRQANNEISAAARAMLQELRNAANSARNNTGSNRGGGTGGNTGGNRGGGTNSNFGGGFGNNAPRGVYAAKGIFVDRPTAIIAGENKKPEIVMPMDKSKGIPDDILKKVGEGLSGALNYSKPSSGGQGNIPYRNPVLGNDTRAASSISNALANLKQGVTLSIGEINVGSNLSREEVRQQFMELEQALIEVFSTSINQ